MFISSLAYYRRAGTAKAATTLWYNLPATQYKTNVKAKYYFHKHYHYTHNFCTKPFLLCLTRSGCSYN